MTYIQNTQVFSFNLLPSSFDPLRTLTGIQVFTQKYANDDVNLFILYVVPNIGQRKGPALGIKCAKARRNRFRFQI